MANEAPGKSLLSVCGAPHCQCTKIMAHLVNSQTPFFFANDNFSTTLGPALPAKFVQDHGHEMAMQVTLEAAGKVFAVELVVGKAGDRNVDSVRMGLGWEGFMLFSTFEVEDLLFFALEGQSRFVVMPVRGHNRRKAEARPPQTMTRSGELKVGKQSLLLSDVLEEKERSRENRAASTLQYQKKKKTGQTSTLRARALRGHPCRLSSPTLGSGSGEEEPASQEPNPVQDDRCSRPPNDHGQQQPFTVVQVSSHDALELYMPLLESTSRSGSDDDDEMEESSGEFEDGSSSDFEDEREFQTYRLRKEARAS